MRPIVDPKIGFLGLRDCAISRFVVKRGIASKDANIATMAHLPAIGRLNIPACLLVTPYGRRTGTVEIPVSDLVAPRIEPEIVLGINERINVTGSEPDGLAEAIAWVAPGFEIIDCHFAGWKFTAADILADFGAHARLAIGSKVMVRASDRGSLATALAAVSVELRCGEVVTASGVGSNALGSPLSGLSFLCDTLADQNWADPIAEGEVITTGTLTDFPYIKRGERWTAEFAGAGLGALTINLI